MRVLESKSEGGTSTEKFFELFISTTCSLLYAANSPRGPRNFICIRERQLDCE